MVVVPSCERYSVQAASGVALNFATVALDHQRGRVSQQMAGFLMQGCIGRVEDTLHDQGAFSGLSRRDNECTGLRKPSTLRI